jgi:tRNA-dihydrouridine synthase B
MLSATGCTGVSIGRGALLNPWIFAQLAAWRETGEAGPAPTHSQRVVFMDRHFHLLVDQRGERFACLTFRKVANWYCKVLRPGRDIQQRLVRIDSVAGFEDIVSRLKEGGPQRQGQEHLEPDGYAVPVPRGPMERW